MLALQNLWESSTIKGFERKPTTSDNDLSKSTPCAYTFPQGNDLSCVANARSTAISEESSNVDLVGRRGLVYEVFTTHKPQSVLPRRDRHGHLAPSSKKAITPKIYESSFTMLDPTELEDAPIDRSCNFIFSYLLFRGPRMAEVQCSYVTNIHRAERRAKDLLMAPVVGLDTEFRAGGGCQLTDKVSLIQVATETQIVLFHVAQFKGKERSDLMPPSLKKLLESPSIVKTGSGIHGDAARLHKYFDCKVQRAYDLKQFLQIVHPKEKGESATLDIMTRRYYGIGLDKTQSNRCTDWTTPLNEKQMEYAASDAYASLQVFQSIDADRQRKNLPSVHQLFAANAKLKPGRKRKANGDRPETLYDVLHRLRDRLATKHGIMGCTIMTNAIIREIARVVPTDALEVLAIHCPTKYEFHDYADEIAEVVATHVKLYRVTGKRQLTTQSTLEHWMSSSQESVESKGTPVSLASSALVDSNGDSSDDDFFADFWSLCEE